MIEDKEKLVRDLIDSFEHRGHLHMAFKKKMKEILINYSVFVSDIVFNLNEEKTENFTQDDMEKIIDQFIDISIGKNN